MKNKRVLQQCNLLMNTLIGAIMGYPKLKEIWNDLDYIMVKNNLTFSDLGC